MHLHLQSPLPLKQKLKRTTSSQICSLRQDHRQLLALGQALYSLMLIRSSCLLSRTRWLQRGTSRLCWPRNIERYVCCAPCPGSVLGLWKGNSHERCKDNIEKTIQYRKTAILELLPVMMLALLCVGLLVTFEIHCVVYSF